MLLLSATMEQVNTVKKYRAYYKEYKANPSDKSFFKEYKAQITLYENALSELKNPIPSSQIQRIFYLNLINYKKKRIPPCKSILRQNPL